MKVAPGDIGSSAIPELKLPEAVHVKSAELWLKLGHPTEALLELQNLSAASRAHPWAAKVIQKAFRAAVGRVHSFI